MLYKVLDAEGRSCNGGCAQWSLPTCNEDGAWTPGDWMLPIEGKLAPCECGYHGARDAQVLEWLGPRLFEMEYRGEMMAEDDKVVCREVRLLRELGGWNARTARLFALWCVREALRIVDLENDTAHSICDVVERFVNGRATSEDMSTAWITAKQVIPRVNTSEWCSRDDIIGYSQAKMAQCLMWSVVFLAHWNHDDEEAWLTSGEIGSPLNMGTFSRFAAHHAARAEAWLAVRHAAEAVKSNDVQWEAWEAGYLQAQQRQYAHLLEMLDQ